MFVTMDRNRGGSTLGLLGRLVAVGALVVGVAGVTPASAQVTKVVTASFAPLTDETSPDKPGLIYEMVREMMKLQKIDKPIEFMAWGDAVKTVDTTKGAITFPMTRTAKRESQYTWLCKAFDMHRSFVGAPGSTKIDTIDAAKALKAVGTTAPSASLNFLKEKGLTNIVEFPTSRDLLQGLKDGKVDVVYEPNPFAKADWKAVGGTGALVIGEPQENSAAYVAANKDSGINPDDWQGALQVLEQEGTFEALVAKYGMD